MTVTSRTPSLWTRERVRRKLSLDRGIDRLARQERRHAAQLRLALRSLEDGVSSGRIRAEELDAGLLRLDAELAVSV